MIGTDRRLPMHTNATTVAKRLLASVAMVALVVGAFARIAPAAEPDVVYFNGKVVTLDPAGSIVSAVAVKDGKILSVGATDELKKLAGPSTRMVDLGGKTVVPGLIDAHCHPMESIYLKEDWVDDRYPGTKSVKQALANIASAVKKTPKGTWIWVACASASQNKFVEKRIPTKAELDAVAPDNPLLLANGGHMAMVNSLAIERLGIKKGTRRLAHGGSVMLDQAGEPTGVLTDALADIPDDPTPAELERYYTKNIQEFWNANGFTSVLALTPAKALPVLQAVAQLPTKPTIRYTISVWTSADGEDMPEDLSKFDMPKGVDRQWYRFAGIKAWIDGENDARTGYMYEPYVGHFDTDPPGNKGILVTDQPHADRFAAIANKAGALCMFHCSGDRATDVGLNAYEKVINSGRPETIMRIEHFGTFQLTDEQLKRAKEMKKHGLYISAQPVWLLDLVKSNFDNMGAKRADTGFRYRAMIDAGLEPAGSTDLTGIYLENINPFLGIWASVTRHSDMGVFHPEQAISVTEAIKMWTLWAAKAMGEAQVKGSLEPGKYADMVVLSDDIFTMPPEGLKEVKPLKTIVGGEVVYTAK
ncbi:amidohydrolase [Candidatus Binatus sp.]|uniref:amidohydrolase n=1 Tax=Candidatus Binatus sp. TaxID=2811406 RepID=UPI003D14910E